MFDAIVPGLAIRVSASGRKTFTLYYRHRRRMRRVGLGRYPDVLLEKARKIATQHRGRIFDGADPAGKKQTEHAQDDNTVQALYELYRTRKEKVLRSWSEVRRIFGKEVLPTWRHRRVADIRRRALPNRRAHNGGSCAVNVKAIFRQRGPESLWLTAGRARREVQALPRREWRFWASMHFARFVVFHEVSVRSTEVYIASEEGVVVVLDAGEKLNVLATNKLDGAILATPALVERNIYVRTESHLYAFGE